MIGRTVSATCELCDGNPLVPFTCRLKMPTADAAGTLTVTSWLAPSGTVKGLAGWVVAPAGSPLMLKVTASVNPFSPLTETVKAGLTPPIVAATCAGEMDRLKSFAAVTVKFNLAACASPPLFPCTVIVATPAVADAGILSVTFWPAPAAIVKGAAGELVVPEGNPAHYMLTAPDNP